MKVAILTIGDEVIEGKIVNTNAELLSKTLEGSNFHVSMHLVVRDDEKDILAGLSFLYQDVDVIVTTGGLGPTADDLTKEICAKYFQEDLILFPEEYEKIKLYFLKSKGSITENNQKQAYFIKGATVLDNMNGTAPGMIYEKAGKVIVNLPGPPKELEPMLYQGVIPYLSKKNNDQIYRKQYRLMNIGESDAETMIKPIMKKYSQIKVSPYASVGVIDYIITTPNIGDKTMFYEACKEFECILKDFIIGDWSKSIQEIVVQLLKAKSLKLAVAESCTGGLVTSTLVEVPGSSEVLKEGIVTYSNEAKVMRLGVKEITLKQYGAVSKQVAAEMAKGVINSSGANIGVSITGIAGPSGGSLEKPVGLVYSAICFNGKTNVFENYFNGDRNKIRLRATIHILYELYKILK